MDLSTQYMGLNLANPIMPGASPLVDDLDTVRRLEDAGAAAIVMHSLFEEQITGEHLASIYQMEAFANSYAEALSYFPRRDDYALGKHEYVEQIRRIKEAVDIPVIASLNGSTPGGWIEYARLMQDAGADALELNVYHIATDMNECGADVEHRMVELVRSVTRSVHIPVAVKLSPFFSSLAHFAAQLDATGAQGLVLFNRFYQPDIDPETLEAKPTLRLSDPTELLLRLRWLAILYQRIDADMALTGGVHSAVDVIKSVMAGATTVQMVSALLMHGPDHITRVLKDLEAWMEEYEYHSISQMCGSVSLRRCADPQAFERGNYLRLLQGGYQTP